MREPRLRPCPYCGSEASYFVAGWGGWNIRLGKCDHCGLQGPRAEAETPYAATKQAADMWNGLRYQRKDPSGGGLEVRGHDEHL